MDRRIRLKVLNFYGGAGIGKSTIAADIFSKLKRKGLKTELVGEYAKWLWYQNATDIVQDQLVMHEHAKFDNVEYLLRRNDEFISIDGRKEKNLERAKGKDEEIKAVLDGAGIGYTVISPWETDRVLLDLKIK
jgi:cytidylate kinase